MLADPRLFEAVFAAINDDEPVVAMRAADAVEKITRTRPDLLYPQLDALLAIAATAEYKEVRWHAAQLLGRVPLTPHQRDRAVDVLLGYLHDRSSIVKTFAMQTLADLSKSDQDLHARVFPLIEQLSATGTPAMRARGRKLLTHPPGDSGEFDSAGAGISSSP